MSGTIKRGESLQLGLGIEQFLLLRFDECHVLWRESENRYQHLPADDLFQSAQILLQVFSFLAGLFDRFKLTFDFESLLLGFH